MDTTKMARDGMQEGSGHILKVRRIAAKGGQPEALAFVFFRR